MRKYGVPMFWGIVGIVEVVCSFVLAYIFNACDRTLFPAGVAIITVALVNCVLFVAFGKVISLLQQNIKTLSANRKEGFVAEHDDPERDTEKVHEIATQSTRDKKVGIVTAVTVVLAVSVFVFCCWLYPDVIMPDSAYGKANSAATSPLYGKKILVIGDSFVRGALPEEDEWASKIASRNNMTAYNFGRSGSPLAYAPVQKYPSIVENLSTITAQVTDVDYVVLLAGHNDANPDINGGSAIPIGENTDMVNTTFKGALNITIDTLLSTYPTARILFLTPFNRRGIEEPYAEAMKEICGIWSIPCFDNYHSSGICFRNEAQAAVYDLNNSLHLNEAGQERISELYESLLANNLPIS